MLPVMEENKVIQMPEAESAPKATAEELPIPTLEMEKQPEADQEVAPSTQTNSTLVQPTQPKPETLPEPMGNDCSSADMVYVPGSGWIHSEGTNHVEFAEDMYENGNKIGIMG